MTEEKDNWIKPIVEIVRQITTPIAAFVLFVIVNLLVARSVADSSLGEAWKGALLAACLAIEAALAVSMVCMAIFCPKNLTYDKDSHVAVDMNARDVPASAAAAAPFVFDLLSDDPARLVELASQIKENDVADGSSADKESPKVAP